MSLGLRTSSDVGVIPKARAATCVFRHSTALPGSFAFQTTARRDTFGTAARNKSNRLPLISDDRHVMPVTLPPGRERLSMRPAATASHATMTTGIVLVARFA